MERANVSSRPLTLDPSAFKDLGIDRIELRDNAYELADFDIWIVEHLIGTGTTMRPRIDFLLVSTYLRRTPSSLTSKPAFFQCCKHFRHIHKEEIRKSYVRSEEERLHKRNSIPYTGLRVFKACPALVRHHTRLAACSRQHHVVVSEPFRWGVPFAVRRVSALSLRMDIRYSDLDVNIRSVDGQLRMARSGARQQTHKALLPPSL